MHLEENAFLAKLVELRIAVEKAGRDELVENAYHKGWKDCEEYIVEGERPRLEYDFARESILKRVLVSHS